MDTNLVSKDAFENREIFFFKLKKKLNFFFLFLKVLKVRRPGRKTSDFWTVRIWKICRTLGPDVMSVKALNDSFSITVL